MKRLSLFNRILLYINYGCALAIVLSYASAYVSPETFWPFAFAGLAYPALLILNSFFFIYWVLRRKKYLFISLISILLGWGYLTSWFRVNNSVSVPNQDCKPAVKVMSFNVRLFDLYNWTNNTATKNRIFNFINNESPDIICFQEFFHHTNGYFPTLDTMVQFLKAGNHHLETTNTVKKHHKWGIATFSAYPIVNKGRIIFQQGDNNICIYSDIKVNEDTLRVYNLHLASIHFKEGDYQNLEDFSVEGSKGSLKRLKAAFLRRARQSEMVADHIRQSPYPVILCGDFNDTPSSYAYRILKTGLKDSFIESGNGLANTYNGRFPSFRIDHIFHSPELSSSGYRRVKKDLSDHYPIYCYVRMPGECE